MPELPEVEVTRRRVEPLLVGRSIREAHTGRRSYFFLTPPARVRRGLRGRVVETLERRGKYLIAALDDGSRLVLHLGMTGQLFADGVRSARLLPARAREVSGVADCAGFRPDAHTHLRLVFDDGGPDLFFRDVRKFGKLLLLPPGATHPRLERLGADALCVTGDHLYRRTRRRSAAIKSLLLDQATIAGVGNIYADEALFHAGIRPTRRAGRVSRRECDALAAALRCVLARSIAAGGASIRDYVAPDGSDGLYQIERSVYARAGQACARCGGRIRRVVVAQRGTHFCPRCQK